MLKRALPAWNDEAGVAKLADEIIAERPPQPHHVRTGNPWRDFAERTKAEPLRDQPSDEDAHWPEAERKALWEFTRAENAAVDAALRGTRAPLAKLLLHEHWEWLGEDTRKLIAEIILGKLRRGRGRPKMARGERWEKTPIHRAAAEVEILQRTFSQHYPKQSLKEVRERAIEIAAKRAKIEDDEKLINYLKRAKRAPQRIK
jgi:hypothetical protein